MKKEMIIPKLIHYCWFGKNPKPDLAIKCISSWKKKCPNYQIIEWNEENFNIETCPLYVRQAYENKMWAFVTDYIRLKIVYDYGGIYFDTDVEVIKNIDDLCTHKAFFGFEDGKNIATGLGFGACKKHPLINALIKDYENISFVKNDGEFDLTPCPQRNTEVFIKYGLIQNDGYQILDDDVLILPSIYLCPIDYSTMRRKWSLKTYTIHWFAASWQSEYEKDQHKKYVDILNKERIDYIKHTPNRLIRFILGQKNYNRLKKLLHRKKLGN